MLLLVVAFGLLISLALCGYRVVFGPQKQLAGLGLGLGVCSVCFCGIAYPQESSPWLVAGYSCAVLLLLVTTVLVGTSFAHWLRTPLKPNA